MATCADVARQVLDLSKATFDNVYLTVDALQRTAEEALLSSADESTWLPEELKAIAHECVGLARRTRRDLKHTTDRCHRVVHAMVDRVLEDDPARAEEPPHRRTSHADREATVVH